MSQSAVLHHTPFHLCLRNEGASHFVTSLGVTATRGMLEVQAEQISASVGYEWNS